MNPYLLIAAHDERQTLDGAERVRPPHGFDMELVSTSEESRDG
jgi:hypothetical protein